MHLVLVLQSATATPGPAGLGTSEVLWVLAVSTAGALCLVVGVWRILRGHRVVESQKEREGTVRFRPTRGEPAPPTMQTGLHAPRPAPPRPVPPRSAPPAGPARPPPPPADPEVKRIGYVPTDIFRQTPTACYPVVVMPDPKSPVKYSVPGRTGNVGKAEKGFARVVARHFGDSFAIYIDRRLITVTGSRAYEPDLTLIHSDDSLRLLVDVEIDEPYSGASRAPTHALRPNGMHTDARRDDAFTQRGWVVVRFTEKQVHQHADACCRTLADVFARIVPDYRLPYALRTVEPVTAVRCWSEEEARAMAGRKEREAYLGISGFGVREGVEIEAARSQSDEGEHIETLVTPPAALPAPAAPPRRRLERPPVIVPPFLPVTPEPVVTPRQRDAPTARPSARIADDGTVVGPDGQQLTDVAELVDRVFPGYLSDRELTFEWEAGLRRRVARVIQNLAPTKAEQMPEHHQMRQFLKDRSPLRTIGNNRLVYDLEAGVAGTYDALFQTGDRQVLLIGLARKHALSREDGPERGLGPLSRRPNTNYWRHALLLNLYRYLLERQDHEQVSAMGIVLLHPSAPAYQMVEVPLMAEEVTAVIAAHRTT